MNSKLIKSAERVFAIVISALALSLLFFRATHAGAIWRDEANSLQLAVMPTLHDVRHNLAFDSFPLLFNLILRAYVDLWHAEFRTVLPTRPIIAQLISG